MRNHPDEKPNRPALFGAGSLLAIYWIAAFTGTHIPSVPGELVEVLGDKILHYLAFGGLAFLAARYCRQRLGGYNFTKAVFIFVILISYGIIDEVTQPYVGRSCSPWDWLADILGTVSGLAAYAGWRWLMPTGEPATQTVR